jgi:hypothetical protein
MEAPEDVLQTPAQERLEALPLLGGVEDRPFQLLGIPAVEGGWDRR